MPVRGGIGTGGKFPLQHSPGINVLVRDTEGFRELFPWADLFLERLADCRAPALDGKTLYITSDYSGSDERSQYDVYSFLLVCRSYTATWLTLRERVRASYMGDGRRMSFKNLSDRQRASALPHFLEAARTLPGICVTVAVSKRVEHLCHPALFLGPDSPMTLSHRWTAASFEQMARTTHFVTLLIAQYSKPAQNVYWISDEDALFSNGNRKTDLTAMLGMWGGAHVVHVLGDVGAGTTGIDTGDRLEEDLAAIPDLVAGATREYVNAASSASGGRIHIGLALPFPSNLSDKSSTIVNWMGASSALIHLSLVIDRGPTGGFFLGRIRAE